MLKRPCLLALAAVMLATCACSQSAWKLITPRPWPSPQGRTGAHVTTDGARLYVFGGRYGSPAVFTPHVSDELWQFDGASWTRLPSGPPAREHAAFAYRPDVGDGRLVVFGGRDVNNTTLGDTWEFDIRTRTWTQLRPATAPSPRRHGAMVFSIVNGACLLFGGYDGLAYRDETWLWDGTTWSLSSPTTRPSPRARMGMTWDFSRGVAVMFGGTSAANIETPLGPETWEWNGATWRLATTATSPYTNGGIGIVSPGMTYDTLRRRIVMTCGAISSSAGTGYQDETWEYLGTDWVSRGSAAVLEARIAPGMAFVPALGRTYLFGGFNPNGVFRSNAAFHDTDDRLFEYSTNHVARFTPSATAAGCPTTLGAPPSIVAAALPWAGQRALIDIVGIPPGASALAFVGPATASTRLGATGCVVHVGDPTMFPTTVRGGVARLKLPIPSFPSLYGSTFHVQGIVFDRGANPLGLALSNRGDAVIGAL